MRKLAALAVCLSGLLVTGCFDIEQTLTLERNMSGKAGFTMKVDMEPMILFMAQMQKQMEGKKGEPTAAEIAKAKADFLAQNKKQTPADAAKDRKDLESKLPKGVTLLDATMQDTGLKMTANILFGFDNASKLSTIELPKKEGGGPESANPMESPFGGLTLVDDGKTVLITSPVTNPAADSESKTPVKLDAESKKQMEAMFKGLRVAFKITAPFTILEQNATRKEGNTLIWEYDIKALEKMKPEQLKQGIRVKYQK